MSAKQPRLTWGGKVILTVGHAASRYGMTEPAIRQAIRRLPLAPIEPPPIDRRTPTWYQADLDKAMKARPGTGANLRGHK